MNKVCRDGYVAVLTSPGYGAGWYTWHKIPELIYDPAVVALVENKASEDEIIQYCEETYPDHSGSFLGAEDLTITWIKEFRVFLIEEYDGNESIRFREDIDWQVA